MRNWTLLSNHGHVLVCLASDRHSRLRDVAADVGITERAVQKIVRDLQDCGMVSVRKRGRRNSYRIHKSQPLRHRLEAHCTIAELVGMVVGKTLDRRAPTQPVTHAGARETLAPKKPAEAESAGEKSRSGTADAVTVDGVERQQGSLF